MWLHMLIEPRDQEWLQRVEAAVMQGRPLVVAAKQAGRYIPSYWNWPELSWFKSGFPSVFLKKLDGPMDYAEAFSSKEGEVAGAVIYRDLESFQDLIAYGRTNERIRSHLLRPGVDYDAPILSNLLEFGIVDFATRIIDRSLHVHGLDVEIEASDIRQFYLELEAPYYEDELGIEILVPIALTRFESDGRVKLAENVSLERLDDQSHQARFPRASAWSPASDNVIAAATHALVLSQYVMPSESIWDRHRSKLGFYPVEVVDRFFAALRLVTGIDTGYAQIVLRPVGWAEDYMATLPPLIPGPSVHSYPDDFEQFGWLVEDREVVTVDQLSEVASTFQELQAAPDPMSLATRRLNSAALRSDEVDSIIDLCIGLEALLTDETHTEMTHKLALRVAALSKLLESRYAPDDVFRAVKRIYNYRSKLVHGKADAADHRTISFLEPPRNQAPEVAAYLLGRVITTLLRSPQYLSPEKIDIDLITGEMSPEAGEGRRGTASGSGEPVSN